MPARTDRIAPVQPAFTLAQLGAITDWSGARPFGLRAKIIVHHPDFLEIVEILHPDPPQLRYLMHPTDCGTVVLSRASGGEWELPTVERALTRLLMLEECSAAP